MKNNNAKILLQRILVSLILWVSFWSYAWAHENSNFFTNNLDQSVKLNLENRLNVFLNKVDTYSQITQNNIYRDLENRIDIYKDRYAVNSDTYAILEIVDLIAQHKLDSDIIFTNWEILSHIIFGQDIPHYTEQEDFDNMNESEMQNDTDDQQDNDIIDENEEFGEYRADLDTDQLNEVDKNILAGTAKWVMQLEVRANLEWVESKTVEFRFNQNIENIWLVGRLYKNWFFVWESSRSDARWNVITIDNLNNFVIDTDTEYVQLELATQAIWKEEIWKTMSNLQVTRTTFKDNTWVITWDKIWDRVNNQTSKNINIVPADLSVSVKSEFTSDSSTSHIDILPLVWNNNENGNIFSPRLSWITLLVSSLSTPGSVNVLNGNGVEIGSWNINWNGNVFISLSPDSISNSGEEYRIITSAEWNFRISQNGILYTAGSDTYTSKLAKQLFLGQK